MHVHGRQPTEAWLFERGSRSPPREHRHCGKRPSAILAIARLRLPSRLEVRLRVEYLVRQARITDVDRLYALCAEKGAVPGGDTPIDAISLLRQLVYLPNASVALVEANHQILGGAVLGLRPSIRSGGFVGTIDVLVVATSIDGEKIADLLIEEMLHSARRKGCTSVEVMLTPDAEFLASWQGHGFARSATNTYRTAVAVRASTSR
jgi:N-acetylglutamate synthase-like GNAT family acetyltransferase